MIEIYCKKLKIGKVFYQDYKEIKADSHEAFLLELLKRELENREVVRKNRLLRAANFDVIKTFEDYIFDNIQIPSTITVDDITAAAFVGKKENLILYGPVGTGKSHLATAIGVEACNQGKKVRFFRTAALVNQLTDAKTASIFLCRPNRWPPGPSPISRYRPLVFAMWRVPGRPVFI